jgi:putative colanic acid biosynthesis glycosyltransferase
MKVLFIDSNYGVGSTGKLVQSIHNVLLNSGYDSIAVFGREGISSNNVFKVSSKIEVFFHALITRISGIYGFWSPFATRKLCNLIEKFKPDVIHIHELHGYYINYFDIIDFISKKGIPIVWTLHSEFDFTGKCGYSFDCNKWQLECQKCPQVHVYPKSFYFDFSKFLFYKKKFAISKVDKIVFSPVSQWLNHKVQKSFLKNFESEIVYNGINNINLFYPRDKIDNGKQYIILSVAPDIFSERKGGKIIFEIAAKLTHLPIKFVVVGSNDNFKSEAKNVVVYPLINNQEKLAELYSSADLFLLTSKQETFSLTTIESLACGTPVIGFDCGGATEIAPTPFGNFVPYGEINLLINLILNCYNQTIVLPSTEECSKFINDNYSIDVMTHRYINIYNNLIKK